MLTLNLAVPAAIRLVRTEVRERMAGDDAAADRAHDRLCDLMERTSCPNLALQATIRRVGRQNALAIGIDPQIVERALRKPVIDTDKDVRQFFILPQAA